MRLAVNAWAARFFRAGYRTASFSSFPFRHSAPWWTVGFQEMVNATRSFSAERADETVPEVLGWFERHARGPGAARIPMILRGPGVPVRVDAALHCQLDAAAMLVEHGRVDAGAGRTSVMHSPA